MGDCFGYSSSLICSFFFPYRCFFIVVNMLSRLFFLYLSRLTYSCPTSNPLHLRNVFLTYIHPLRHSLIPHSRLITLSLVYDPLICSLMYITSAIVVSAKSSDVLLVTTWCDRKSNSEFVIVSFNLCFEIDLSLETFGLSEILSF